MATDAQSKPPPTPAAKLLDPLRAAWQGLTSPSPAVHLPERRRDAQLISSIILALLVPTLVGAITSRLLPIGMAFAFLLVAYLVSRTRHFAYSKYLTIIVISVPSYAGLIGEAAFSSAAIHSHVAWLALPILMSSFLKIEMKLKS